MMTTLGFTVYDDDDIGIISYVYYFIFDNENVPLIWK